MAFELLSGVFVMRIAVIITLVSLFLPVVAQAQHAQVEPPTCVTGSPGSPACTELASVEPGWAAAPALQAGADPDLSAVRHSFYLPTGNLTRSGEFAASVHEFGLFNTISYGVSDHLEISAGAPAIPIVWSVGARLSLTSPDSPLRAVVGGSIWMPLVQESQNRFEYIRQGTVTLGYQTDRWNIHGSLSALQPNFDDDTLFLGSVGFLYRTGKKSALMLDIATVDVNQFRSCSSGCSNPPLARIVTAGVKRMGKKWDMDFGVFVPIVKENVGTHLMLIPLVSVHRR
jgi:hypothetical protein